MTLPTDAHARKAVPIFSGVLMYFPGALAAVAECSKKGNDQHNPGKPLHWDRSKSQDEHDALVRHLMEAGTVDTDGIRHSAKVAWRALAALQKEIEKERVSEMKDPAPAPVSLTPGGVQWIINYSGKPPLLPDAQRVEVMFRDGERGVGVVGGLRWTKADSVSDIVGYRILS